MTRTLGKRDPSKNLGYLLVGLHVCPLSRKCWNSKKELAHVANSVSVRCLSIVPLPDLTSKDLTLKQARSFQEVLLFSCLICFSWHKTGFGNLMFSFWFTLFGGSFVFLEVGPSILFLVFPFFLGALVYL